MIYCKVLVENLKYLHYFFCRKFKKKKTGCWKIRMHLGKAKTTIEVQAKNGRRRDEVNGNEIASSISNYHFKRRITSGFLTKINRMKLLHLAVKHYEAFVFYRTFQCFPNNNFIAHSHHSSFGILFITKNALV